MLVLLMELGTESLYQKSSLVNVKLPGPTHNGRFQELTNRYVEASGKFRACRSEKAKHCARKGVTEARQAMDEYNRFTISIRGKSRFTYKILDEAEITKEFSTLLDTSMPPQTDQDIAIQHSSMQLEPHPHH